MEGLHMITLLTLGLIICLTMAIARWIAAAPLLRTLSASIDSWAEGVHGREAEPS